jgi:hypothetical protein
MDMQDINSFLIAKGIPESELDQTAPYEVLRIINNFSVESGVFEFLHNHFGKTKYDAKEAESIMNRFSTDLQTFLVKNSLTESESIKCAALLDTIFSFEAWLSFAGEPLEWGQSEVFRDFDETIYLINQKTEKHLSKEKLKMLSETRGGPTVVSALSKNIESELAGYYFQNGYEAMFSNNPNLPQVLISSELTNGNLDLIFHKNADPKLAKSTFLNALDELEDDFDSSEIAVVLNGWQSMVESGWRYITAWPSMPHSKGLLKILDTWLENNGDGETVEDYLNQQGG